MMDTNLEKELIDLHKELKKIKSLDKDAITQLTALRDDINKVIDSGAAAEHGRLKLALEEFVEHFEETHPTLIATANRAIRLLGQMGISG